MAPGCIPCGRCRRRSVERSSCTTQRHPRRTCAASVPGRQRECMRTDQGVRLRRGRARRVAGMPPAVSESMKLICAIDFSEPSLEAARVAVRLARRFGDELLLVHAWTSPLLYYRELIADPLRVEEKAVAKVTVDLESLAQTFRAQGLTVTPRLVHDADPAEALTALGREVDARLIVVGAHSRRA